MNFKNKLTYLNSIYLPKLISRIDHRWAKKIVEAGEISNFLEVFLAQWIECNIEG